MSLMLAEIREQPQVLQRTLTAALERLPQLAAALRKRPPRFIVLAARGTSDNAALAGRYLLETTTGIPVSLAAPSVLTQYEAPLHYEGALIVGISQSGESTDVNFVVQKARDRGALTVGITNEASSSLAKVAEIVLPVEGGKERSVAATKTYTGQLLAFYLLAQSLGGRIETEYLRRIPEWVASALSVEEEVRSATERYLFMEHTVVVARGLNYASAFEFSLKLMETSYVLAERFSAADFLHGPIALIESLFPVFLFAPAGPSWRSMSEMLDKLRHLQAEALVFSDRSNTALSAEKTHILRIPESLAPSGVTPADLYTPIPYIVPAQLFAAHLAARKGRDPDQPRGLRKITQTL